MIGLKRGTVKLRPYNHSWKESFKKERALLKRALAALAVDIEHVGSTSIPNIIAKPIIDISLGIRSKESFKEVSKLLGKAGYKFRRRINGADFHALLVKGHESKRTHYLHVLEFGSETWKNDLLFRNYLRQNKNRAREYLELKTKLATKFASDRKKYTEGKSKFILETLKLAKT